MLSLVVCLVLVVPAATSLAPALPEETVVEDAQRGAVLDPDLDRLLKADSAVLDVIVHFGEERHLRDHMETLDRPVLPFPTLPGVAYAASVQEVRDLATTPGVVYVEHDAKLPVLLETAVVASRAAAVWDTLEDGPILHPETGAVVDGSGVGVAVIDTGADGTNPNLGPALVKNFQVIGPRDLVGDWAPEHFVEMEDTDVGSGHGTHVAGIVGARGIDGPKGAAPGAGLYAFSAGAGLHIITSFAVASFDWVLQHHDQVDPPIRVITNSYGNVGAYNPNSAIAKMTTKAIDANLSVVFAAGNGDVLNNGGSGTDNRLSSYAQHPAGGVLGVANYDDSNNGTRDGSLAPSSSRGRASNPSTWPDLSAPGTSIVSTMAKTDALGWALLSPLVEQDGNSLGNAVNQWRGTAAFRFADTDSEPATLALVHWAPPLQPVVIYNAHQDGYLVQHDLTEVVADPTAVLQARVFADVPEPVPPVYPADASERALAPGDKIRLVAENGTALSPVFRIIAPNGDEKEIQLRFDCLQGCAAEIDLYEVFGAVPADGTWTLTFGRTIRGEPDFHTTATGTSMAAPHVAGVIALMYQANPALRPAQVEEILKETAYRFTFGSPYTEDGSFDKGHGLVDAQAAVLQAFVTEEEEDEVTDPEDPPLAPVDPIRTYTWEGRSIVDSWPHTAPPTFGFDVRRDDRLILAEMRWEGTLGQGVDLIVYQPRDCPLIECAAPAWVTKESEGAHRAEGDPLPTQSGALRILLDETVVTGIDCDTVCEWRSGALPTLAVLVDYDIRITVVNEGELPEGYTAFEDEGPAS